MTIITHAKITKIFHLKASLEGVKKTCRYCTSGHGLAGMVVMG